VKALASLVDVQVLLNAALHFAVGLSFSNGLVLHVPKAFQLVQCHVLLLARDVHHLEALTQTVPCYESLEVSIVHAVCRTISFLQSRIECPVRRNLPFASQLLILLHYLIDLIFLDFSVVLLNICRMKRR
jgi:hypothetical protein